MSGVGQTLSTLRLLRECDLVSCIVLCVGDLRGEGWDYFGDSVWGGEGVEGGALGVFWWFVWGR